MAREVDLGSIVGPAGKSAYEVWLSQEGNAGKTEAQFLASLKGEKGDPGSGGGGASSAEDVSYGDETVKDALDTLNSKMADVLYQAVAITSFTNNVNTVEKGSTVNTVVLNWATNKTPKTLTLDGAALDVSLKTKTIEGAAIKANKTYTLKATDERNAAATRTTSITFLNGVYWGAAARPETADSAFLLTLSKELLGGRAKTFTVNCGAGQNIFYAIPSGYGTPAFKVGGFDGGFGKMGTIDFTNASGYTEKYDVWISDNQSLGNTTVEVK